MDRFSFNQSNRALYRFDQILFSFLQVVIS